MDESKWGFPTDPEVKITAAIAFGSVAVLVLIARVFRDVNPA